MNHLLVSFACVLFCAALTSSQGIPIRHCPPGEHSVLYCPQKAEPSCETPFIRDMSGGACDVPQCFCDAPRVRQRSGKCVEKWQC